MMDSAAALTARIYDLLGQGIGPVERRKRIEELIRDALSKTRQTFESRIAALEELAHEPFDFSDLIRRLEALERGGVEHEERMSEARTSIERGARLSNYRFKLEEPANPSSEAERSEA